MASVIGWLGKKAKAIEAQINPFDGGQTYNTVVNNTPPAAPPQQQPGQPPRPTGLNRIPGAGIVKSIATPFLDTAKFAAVDAPKMEIKKTFAGITGNKVAAQNAQDQYVQSFRKTIPGGVYNNAERAANFGVALAQDPLIQRDINAGKYSPEAGNQLRDQNFAKAGFGAGYQNLSAGQAAKKIAPIVAAPIRDALTLGSAPEAKGITGVAKVGAINAVGSLPESLSQDNASLKSVAKDAATSFGVGALLAAPGAIGGRELPQTQRTTTPVKVPTLRPNEARTLSDLQDVYTGNIKNVKTQAAVLKDARAIQDRTGLDVTTGSPADIQTRINSALDQPQNSKRFFTPLNDVGAVGKDVRPEDLRRQPGVVLADGVTRGGQVVQKVLGKPGESGIRTVNTGIRDKALLEMQKAHNQIVTAEARNILESQKPATNIRAEVMKHGGISASDYESLPSSYKRKSGVGSDKMAQILGYPDEATFIKAVEAEKSAPKGLTLAQAKEQATSQLQSGNGQFSREYQDVLSNIKQRQSEISLYPSGARKQVTIKGNRPTGMSEAEWQSLLNTPDARNPVGNRIPDLGKKTMRNADAERIVQQQLKQGANPDQMVRDYQKATGASLQVAVHDIQRVAKESGNVTNLGKNPLEGTVDVPAVQSGDFKQAKLNADYVLNHEKSVGQNALSSYKQLTPHDQVLLKDIETSPVSEVAKRAENPQAFTQAESAIRNYYDTRHAWDKRLDIGVGYRTNYLRQLFDKVEQQAPQDKSFPTGGSKNPGYTKSRTFDTLGTDVGTALERDIAGSSFNHAKLTYQKGLNEAFPGQINAGEIVRTPEAGVHQQILSPYGKDLVAPKDIAQQINSRSWQPTESKALQTYDKVNRGLKYVKLSGGLFHAFTEAGNFVGQQLGSGKLFSNPTATGKLVKTFFSSKAMDGEMVRFAKDGTLDKARITGLSIAPQEILADANVKLGGKISKYTGVQALHDATFKREIPYAKMKIFEQKTQGLDIHNPTDLAKMKDVSRELNQAFGGINREIQGIKPGTFKWLQRGLLATDFTEGKIHTLFDAAASGGEAGKLARQVVLGKALLFGVAATAGGAVSGEYNNKTPEEIARNAGGNLLDPTFQAGGYKVGFPKTHISEAVDPLKSLVVGNPTNGKRDASGLQHYVTARTAALPSELNQLLTNKDYYGQPLYGNNTKKNGGGPIGAAGTAVNIGNTVLPIPVGQGIATAKGKQPVIAAAANIGGLNVRPNPDAAKAASLKGVDTNITNAQAEQTKANQDLKTKFSAQDNILRGLNKAERQKLIDKGVVTADQLKGLDNYEKNQKAQLGLSLPDNSGDKSPKAAYTRLLDTYNKRKSNGELTGATAIKADTELKAARVKSDYEKGIVDAYSLGTTQLNNFLTTDKNGKATWDKLQELDKKMADAGFKPKFQDKYGNTKFPSAKSGKGKGRKGSGKLVSTGFKTAHYTGVSKAPKFALKKKATLAKSSTKLTLPKLA